MQDISKSVEISLISMNYSMNYQYEIVHSLKNVALSPVSEKYTFKILEALSTNSFVLCKGPQLTGKYTLFKVIFL